MSYKYLFLFLLTLASRNYSQAQIKSCQNNITPESDNTLPKIKADGPGKPGQLHITFESGFSDSAIVLINNKVIFRDKLETSEALGRCNKYVKIDYSLYKKRPGISVFLIKSGECIYFYPIRNKKRAYINRDENNKWSILLTNNMHFYW